MPGVWVRYSVHRLDPKTSDWTKFRERQVLVALSLGDGGASLLSAGPCV